MKKFFFLSLLSVFLTVTYLNAALAYDAEWQANQTKAFERLGLKPTDVIDASNWEKVKDCLPPSIVNWVKKGEFVLKLGEFKYDFSHDEAYEKGSMANKGKYKLGDRTEVLDIATGQIPMYVDGRPFPDVDVKNDPMGPTKLMHNSSGDRFRTGGTRTDFEIQWIGEKGMERYLYGYDMFFYYWSRPDGQIENPQKVKRFEITTLNEPYDLFGNVMLYHYWLDGSPERFVQYIPSIRRIKKMNVTDRSSPFFGTDFCNDDGGGYVGQVEAMNWKFIEEKTFLVPMADWALDSPVKCVQQPNKSWRTTSGGTYQYGYESGEGVAWNPSFCRWVPRTMYVLEMNSKDPYYAYGKQYLYVDKVSNSISYKIVYDKSGGYWKTLLVAYDPVQWGKNRSMTMQITYVQVDDKSHHASICNAHGVSQGGKFDFNYSINDPDNNPSIYKDEKIATMTK